MRLTALFPSEQQAELAANELRQQGAGDVRYSVLGTTEPLNGADPRIDILEREERASGDDAHLHSVGWPREATRLPDGPHNVGAVLVAFETDGGLSEAALQDALERHGGEIHRGVTGDS